MPPNSKKMALNYKRKNRKKVLSVIFQLGVLLVLLVIVIQATFITSTHTPFSKNKAVNEEGFVALSYFGVSRSGSPKHIARDELEKQLTALQERGFKTISQQQVLDFYENGKPLPEKALFLSFEDGRTDSSIFSQPILQKLNYKATMFTYADKMETRDTKFLKPPHLKQMIDSGYWELGSNGYQLTYINVFNADGEYLGNFAENDVPDKTTIEYYNHYLMDFFRDEYMIPIETREEMEERIQTDYERMSEVYNESFSSMPKVYAIMHANSLYNNMHAAVEAVNDKMIKKYFSLHFNRDFQAYNSRTEDLYNLHRLQVSPNWSLNHLLMKIRDDTNWQIDFEPGDRTVARKWSIINGVGEFDWGNIILTTEPGEEVQATLREKLPSSFTAHFHLKGNVMGRQTIYVQSVDSLEKVKIVFEKNKLHAYYENEREQLLLMSNELEPLGWSGEDYAFNKATQYDYLDTQQGSRIAEDEYPSTLANNRYITLTLADDRLQVLVDRKESFEVTMPFSSSSYEFTLGGSTISRQTTHEQGIDTIYDSIFENVKITSGDTTIYTVHISKIDTLLDAARRKSSDIIDYFIEKF